MRKHDVFVLIDVLMRLLFIVISVIHAVYYFNKDTSLFLVWLILGYLLASIDSKPEKEKPVVKYYT